MVVVSVSLLSNSSTHSKDVNDSPLFIFYLLHLR